MTCSLCRQWMATSREQYKNRLELLRNYPSSAAHPCPVCISGAWATTPPEGVDHLEIVMELDNERAIRLRAEERRYRRYGWLLFWRKRK